MQCYIAGDQESMTAFLGIITIINSYNLKRYVKIKRLLSQFNYYISWYATERRLLKWLIMYNTIRLNHRVLLGKQRYLIEWLQIYKAGECNIQDKELRILTYTCTKKEKEEK